MISMTIQEDVFKPFNRGNETGFDQKRHQHDLRHSLDSKCQSGFDPQRHQPSRRRSSDSMSKSGFHPLQHRPRRPHSLDSVQRHPPSRRHSSDSTSRNGFNPQRHPWPPYRRHSTDSIPPRKNSDTEARRKAAAWAWYQHGGSNEVPMTRIVGGKVVTRVGTAELPMSRFKTETTRKSNNIDPSGSSVWDCESTLYDAFELSSFSEQLAHILQGVPKSGNSSSNRLGPRLQQTVLSRSRSDLSVPRYCPSTTPTNEIHNQSVADDVHFASYAAVCDKKSAGSRRSFFFLNKVFQKILKRKSMSEEKFREQDQEHHHYHNHHHHHHHHFLHEKDKIPALAPTGKVLRRKTLGSLFASSGHVSAD